VLIIADNAMIARSQAAQQAGGPLLDVTQRVPLSER
jgi:hypothetical protein